MNLDKFILKSYLDNMAKRIIILSSLLLFFGVSFARTNPELSYDEAKKNVLKYLQVYTIHMMQNLRVIVILYNSITLMGEDWRLREI